MKKDIIFSRTCGAKPPVNTEHIVFVSKNGWEGLNNFQIQFHTVKGVVIWVYQDIHTRDRVYEEICETYFKEIV